MVDKKTKFRARKLDYTRTLKVLDVEDLGDEVGESLMDGSPVRTAPLMSTGVDKEEEEEEHLQAALSAALVVPKSQSYVIPTPHVEELKSIEWESLYPAIGKKKKGEEQMAISLLDGYCADEEDVAFSQELALTIDTLEKLFEFWEEASQRLSAKSIPASSAGERFPSISTSILERAHAKWVEKKQASRLMIGSLKHEDLDKIGADPYVCFRRRELKLPRKTRRSDAQCVDKLRKMRFELETLSSGLEMLTRRDEWRRMSLQVEAELFQQYRQLTVEERTKLPPFKSATSRRATEKENNRRLLKLNLSVASTNPFQKPYFPPGELSAQIVNEIESLLGRMKLPMVDDEEATQEAYKPFKGVQARMRRGRAGRILIDRAEVEDQQELFLPLPSARSRNKGAASSIQPTGGGKHPPSLSLKECAQLNNAAVGNYNQHYLTSSSGLVMPYSFFGWVSLSSEHNLMPSDRSNKNGGNSPSKRQKTSAGGGATSAPLNSSTKLAAGNNITVKVKTRTSLESSGDSGDSSPYQQPSQASVSSGAGVTHFTPIGLHRGKPSSEGGGGGNKT